MIEEIDLSGHRYRDIADSVRMFIYERYVLVAVPLWFSYIPILDEYSHQDARLFIENQEKLRIRKRFKSGTILDKEQEKRFYLPIEDFLKNPDCYWAIRNDYNPKNISDIDRDMADMKGRCK